MIGLYFSGTGNSRWAVERLLQECGFPAQAYAIEDEQAADRLAAHEEVVFAYPVQYSALPKLVGDFVQTHAALWRGKRVFVIATMALSAATAQGCWHESWRSMVRLSSAGCICKCPTALPTKRC